MVKVNLLPGGRAVWKVYSVLPSNRVAAERREQNS